MIQKQQRLRQIDGLRGIAMLFVFMGHFGSVWRELLNPAGMAGYYLTIVDADSTFGSSFFMLLSSFFTYGSLMRAGRKPGEFLRGRVQRLYPLYLLMCLVYIAGSLAIPSMSKLPADPSAAAVKIAAAMLFLPGILPVAPIIDVAWTLSFIFLFYFIAAGVTAVFRKLQIVRARRMVILAIAGLVWTWAGPHLFGWEHRTAMFWVGMAARELVDAVTTSERLNWATRLIVPAAVLTILGAVARTVLMVLHPDTGPVPILFWRFLITAVTLVAFVWIAYFGPNWWKHALSSPGICALGAASYSFYLTHGLAVKVFRYFLIPKLGLLAASPLFFWPSQLLGLLMAVMIARVVFTRVENPLTNLVARWTKPQPGIAAAPAPATSTAVLQNQGA